MEITIQKSLIDIAKEAFNAKEMRKYYEDLEKDLLDQLKKACGYKDFILNGYVFQKSLRNGSIDYQALLKDFNIDATPYRKEEVEIWKLSYIKEQQ
jgi:hypothetical protein